MRKIVCGRSFGKASKAALLLTLVFSAPCRLLSQSSGADLLRNFQSPPDDAKPMMRWWWFGAAVTKPELEQELRTMHGVGIGGVEIQPVYPLTLDDQAAGIRNLPYLSHEFLDAVNFANATARSMGMRVDITLGSGWPYGGPKTTLGLAAGRLRVISEPVGAGAIARPRLADGESPIAGFVVSGTATSFDAASARPIDLASGAAPAGDGNRTALFFVASHTEQMVKRAAAGAEGYVLDHFSRAAIDEHLGDVAAPLIGAFGEQPPYSVFSDSLEVYGSDWTANLPEEFLKRRGYDLVPHLPELLIGGTPEAEAVRHDWGETLSDLVRDNYLSPITSFAEAHGTRFRSQTYGEPAVTLADEAIPNLPEGEGPQWRAFSFTRWASSASHVYGRNVTSAETWTWLHSPAFRATPLDMKAEADRMFLLGVNQIVGHGYPYSPAAAGEPGWSLYAAAALNSHNPWFPVMPDAMGYLQRVSWLLRQGRPANDVAILLPEDDAQAAFSPGHVSVTDEMKKRISPELMGAILDAGYNIDYIDAATIDKLDVIPYPILILPSVTRLPVSAYRRIERFAAGSGRVIAIGELPSLAPGLKEAGSSQEVAALSERLFRGNAAPGTLLDSLAKLPDALHRALPADMLATGEMAGIGFIRRRLGDGDVYFVANTSNVPVRGSVTFRSEYLNIATLDPDSGAVLSSSGRGKGDAVALELAPYESRVFVLTKDPAAAITRGLHGEGQKVTQLEDLSDGWTVRFSNSSTHFMDKLVSWTELPGGQYYSGEVTYSREFDMKGGAGKELSTFIDFGVGAAIPDTRRADAPGMRALLDPPIREAAVVEVNGQRAGSLWHPPYRIDVSRFVHAGKNHLTVHVYNTAVNEMAGKPRPDYTALNAKYGKRFEPQDMENLRPVPSGLLGPIRLLAEGGGRR